MHPEFGGGEGAFIGGVHRIALRLDGHYELVAGCFSSNLSKINVNSCKLVTTIVD